MSGPRPADGAAAPESVSLPFEGRVLTIAADDIDPRIRRRGLPFELDLERLWALPGTPSRLETDRLRWMLELPYWPVGDRLFAVTPHEVLARPGRFPVHDRKIKTADLELPIDVTWYRRRWLILDGLHRLARAVALGRPEVLVRKHRSQDVSHGASRSPHLVETRMA